MILPVAKHDAENNIDRVIVDSSVVMISPDVSRHVAIEKRGGRYRVLVGFAFDDGGGLPNCPGQWVDVGKDLSWVEAIDEARNHVDQAEESARNRTGALRCPVTNPPRQTTRAVRDLSEQAMLRALRSCSIKVTTQDRFRFSVTDVLLVIAAVALAVHCIFY